MSKDEEKKEIVKKEDAMTPEQVKTILGDDMSDMMSGVDMRLPEIKILHGGALMFRMPDGETTKAFEANIVDITKQNGWWAKSFDETGGGAPPDCASFDGIRPDLNSNDPQHETCEGCPKNKFGSKVAKDGQEGRGKACKNMKVVHVFMQGYNMPTRLIVPPGTIKALDVYVSALANQGVPYLFVNTEFGLEEKANKDGIKFSGITLKNAGMVSMEDAKKLKAFRDNWLNVMRNTTVLSDGNE